MQASDDFSYWGKHMINFINEYMNNLSKQKVVPNVEPGYLRLLLPEEAPENPEKWPDLFNDIKQFILPGLTHWQHPHFHAYFPAAGSIPSIMADMLSGALGCNGFSWSASPAITELELVMCDWVAKMMKLPEIFLHSHGDGGGIIQSSASDCIFISMLAARHQAIENYKVLCENNGDLHPETTILSKLVAYASVQAHSCVEKACMLAFVKFHPLPIDNDYSVRGNTLRTAMEEDEACGLIPFYVCATLGTTACCSFDDLASIGPVCREKNIWLHVDAAYAGNAFICPEFRYLLNGVQDVWSININPNKWMLVGFDCSLMWVRDSRILTQSMIVNPVYLQHKHSSKALDLRHWGIPLSRRFRALKLWFVIRIYGISGLRAYIRRHVLLAQRFANHVRNDDRFEIIGNPIMGLVCFRIKGSNILNKYLVRAINESRELHVVPAVVNETYFIRFAICREEAKTDDVDFAWLIIQTIAKEILAAQKTLYQWSQHVSCNSIENNQKDKILNNSDESGLANSVGESILTETNLADDNLMTLIQKRLDELKKFGAKEACSILFEYVETLKLTDQSYDNYHTKNDDNNDDDDNNNNSLVTTKSKLTKQSISIQNNDNEEGITNLFEFPNIEKDSSNHNATNELVNQSVLIESPNQLSTPNSNLNEELDKMKEMYSPIHVKIPTCDYFDFLHSDSLTRFNGISNNNNNNDDNLDETFVCEQDLCVGSIKNNTLAKLRRQTLIRMISDPVYCETDKMVFSDFGDHEKMVEISSTSHKTPECIYNSPPSVKNQFTLKAFSTPKQSLIHESFQQNKSDLLDNEIKDAEN